MDIWFSLFPLCISFKINCFISNLPSIHFCLFKKATIFCSFLGLSREYGKIGKKYFLNLLYIINSEFLNRSDKYSDNTNFLDIGDFKIIIS